MRDPLEALIDVLTPESIAYVQNQVVRALHHGGCREGETVQQAEYRALIEAVRRECGVEKIELIRRSREMQEANRASLEKGYRDSLEHRHAEIDRLAKVKALYTVRRKTLSMDALAEALFGGAT